VSRFCGVEVLTYAVLDNHFHLLVYVPKRTNLSDRDLVERYRALYPHRPKLVQEVEARLDEGGHQAEELRTRLQKRMHDVSMFLKELKQRFTMWFNAHHKLYGTIWAERFKSLLVENDASTLRTVAAYIDLNSMRARMVKKPDDYRWCGMSAAERGDTKAQAGVIFMMRTSNWTEARKMYRRFVHEASLRQVKEKPHETIDDPCLMARQTSLSDGWIIGSRAFVRDHRSARSCPSSTQVPATES
jgi:REP element-mobilizing transposase RayT